MMRELDKYVRGRAVVVATGRVKALAAEGGLQWKTRKITENYLWNFDHFFLSFVFFVGSIQITFRNC